MSKVDILIPAFNAARFLPDAIESVIAQVESDWHIVVVDDGSTDNTHAVVEPYLARLGNKITYIYQDNRGLPAARNSGIRASSAPLIALLDADDLWLPNRLVDSLALFDRDPAVGLAYGGVVRFREPGIALDTFLGNARGGQGHVARAIYTRKIELPCPTITFRRTCIESVGYFDETLRASEDRDMWLRIAQRFRVGFVPSVLAWYRLSEGSMSSDMLRMLQAQTRVIQKHYGEPGCDWAARQIALARAHRQQAEGYASRKQYAASVRHSLKAAALAPWEISNLRALASIGLRAFNLREPLAPLGSSVR